MSLSAVYSCVRLIASSLATLDLHLHRVNGTQREIAQDRSHLPAGEQHTM